MSTLSDAVKAELQPAEKIKLDIGAGPNPKEGYVGLDNLPFEKAYQCELGKKGPWKIYSKVGQTVPNCFDKQRLSVGGIGGGKEEIFYTLPDGCVEAANCTHFLEHLTNFNDKWERVYFWNELWRVMAHRASLNLVVPHWASNRYYGDPTHKEPWSEMAFYYLDRNWRLQNAPHSDISNNPNGYCCDWEFNVGYSMHASVIPRNAEYQQYALAFYKEAAQDLMATMYARKE